MTSTGQELPAKADASPEPAKQAEAKETRQVPLDALAEARQKARAAEERIVALESELAQSKKSPAPAAEAQPRQVQDDDSLKKDIAQLKRDRAREQLSRKLGLADDVQVDAVEALLAKNAGLTEVEALELAAKREPEKFKDRGQPGYDPKIHGSTRPHSGSPPEAQPSERKKRLEAIAKATGNDRSVKLNEFSGSLAAKAMGWEHKKVHLP